MEEVETIIDVFSEQNNKPELIKRPDISNNIDSFYYDISKAKEVLGWSPSFSFKDMLVDFIKESSAKKFSHLVDKRQVNINEYNQ